MTAPDPILQSLGRMEGKLDAALGQLAGHDDDIDELRRDVGALKQESTAQKTTLRVAWGAIGLLVAGLAIVAGFMQAAGR